jgi:hypothetical protein
MSRECARNPIHVSSGSYGLRDMVDDVDGGFQLHTTYLANSAQPQQLFVFYPVSVKERLVALPCYLFLLFYLCNADRASKRERASERASERACAPERERERARERESERASEREHGTRGYACLGKSCHGAAGFESGRCGVS